MIQFGTKVKIRQVRDALSQGRSTKKVGETGVVRNGRPVDGSEIGYIVEFPDGVQGWFFAEELETL